MRRLYNRHNKLHEINFDRITKYVRIDPRTTIQVDAKLSDVEARERFVNNLAVGRLNTRSDYGNHSMFD